MRKKQILGRLPGDVHSIESFCRANGISVTTYFVMKRKGKAPREMRVGKRVLITPEAEADWRCERENDHSRL
jgi:hypothetical protein